ncbi:MAG: hypothetical protein HDS71_04640 [Bacteroidales bacterium]|nr:hypothetical protein [Bacteroidales bacterium]MBD5223324.1 hypothetical protein [Bacteroidales bacterium]MBD5301403.1 hypothetical protein [Bacteroides sp.]
MKKTAIQLFLLCSCAVCTCMAETIDWEKIKFWSGEGEHKAALVIQFKPDTQPNPGALVWGYRWRDGENPTGEDMARAVAGGSDDLTLFTQFTGEMGNTVCGFGYAKSREALLNSLVYDYEGALTDNRISFGLETPNTGMNQTDAPGYEAVQMVYEAIDMAKITHIIEHPLNQLQFGYACYDYDWWQPASESETTDSYWNAGWYDGFWSYWVGEEKMEDLGYSGLGMSSVILSDGDVNGWRYLDIDGNSGASIRAELPKTAENQSWLPLNYTHFSTPTEVQNNVFNQGNSVTEYYTLEGHRVSQPTTPGIYIKKEGKKIHKFIIK